MRPLMETFNLATWQRLIKLLGALVCYLSEIELQPLQMTHFSQVNKSGVRDLGARKVQVFQPRKSL